MTGLIQLGVLMVSSSLIFRLNWGAPLPVFLLCLAVVAAMTGLGMALAAFARTERQADLLSTAVLLIFGALGGSFLPRLNWPTWLETASLITPNAWGLEGFYKLAQGAGVDGIWTELVALLVMATVLFIVGLVGFRRRMAS